MEETKVFCENCREDTGYTVTECQMTGTIKDKEYHYIGKEAYCQKCGKPVWVPEFHDSNLEALYNVYRTENGIISLEEVRSIPEKYNIGKRPLSLLLGWGELTLSRYLDGDTPSRQYSDILCQISRDPLCYLSLLEKNKDKLDSDLTYNKSKKAVLELLGDKQPELAEKENELAYIVTCCQDINIRQSVIKYLNQQFA